MKTIIKFGDILCKIAEWILMTLLAAMTVVVFVQVVFRWIGAALPWSEEFARYCMIFLTYVGASIGIKRKSLVAIEAVVVLLPKKVQHIIEILVYLLIVVVSAVVFYYAWMLCARTMGQISPAMHIPMGFMYGALVIGFALVIVQAVIVIIRDLTPDREEALHV